MRIEPTIDYKNIVITLPVNEFKVLAGLVNTGTDRQRGYVSAQEATINGAFVRANMNLEAIENLNKKPTL